MNFPPLPRLAWLSITLVGLTLALTWVWQTLLCPSPAHIPADIVYEYRLRYTPGQIQPGWRLLSVGRNVDRPATLVHRVEVPPELAGELIMMNGWTRRSKVAEIACPSASHPIWSRLTRGQDVEVVLSSERGAFDTVSCRAEMR